MINSTITYRRASQEDEDVIVTLENECMAHPWDISLVSDLLNNPRGGAFVAYNKCNGEVKGYIGFTYVLDELEIGNICVMSDCRRMGIGYGLLSSLVDFCKEKDIKKIFLEVNSSNSAAISLYDKFGFVKYSVRKNYYGSGHDANMMVFET